MTNRTRGALTTALSALALSLTVAACSNSSGAGTTASATAANAPTPSGKASTAASVRPTASAAAAQSSSAQAPSEPKQPRALATGQKAVSDLAVSSDTVYWVSDEAGAVMSVPLAGGEVKSLAKLTRPISIALREGEVLVGTWGDNPTAPAQLLSVPTSGGEPKEIVKAEFPVNQIVVDGTKIYFASASAVTLVADGKAATFASVEPMRAVIALGQGGLYVGRFPVSMELTEPTGRLDFFAFDGKRTPIASNQAGPNGILSLGTDVYWVNSGVESEHYEKSVMALPSGESKPKKLGDWSATAGTLAGDKERIYWADGDSSIFGAPRAGGAPEVVVKARSVTRIIATSSAIVWATNDSVMTLPR